MKADIKSDGTLTITPDSQLEEYALKKWCENYLKGEDSSKLKICNLEDPIHFGFVHYPISNEKAD